MCEGKTTITAGPLTVKPKPNDADTADITWDPWPTEASANTGGKRHALASRPGPAKSRDVRPSTSGTWHTGCRAVPSGRSSDPPPRAGVTKSSPQVPSP